MANHRIPEKCFSLVIFIVHNSSSLGDGAFAADGSPCVEGDIEIALIAGEKVVVFGVAFKAFFPSQFVVTEYGDSIPQFAILVLTK